MSSKRRGEKGVLSRQEIAVRKRALKDKKQQRGGGQGRRAIVGVVLLAVSMLTLLSVASFDVHDRLGPGFRNLIGPVGHALAEALRGFFGVTALALPVLGLYAAFTLFAGDREKRRWAQVLSLALLVVCATVLAQLTFREDPSWAHAPGGLLGRSLSQVMTALFSTVGTVVLVSATASVAFIVGTEYAFLRLCGWAWAGAVSLAGRARALAASALETWQDRAEARREQAEKDQAEEAEFLAQLEAQESELSELEAAASEAEAAAEEVARQEHQREALRLGEAAERERLRVERERLLVEREAARLAREALKTARATQKDARKESAAALAPALLSEAAAPLHAAPVGALAGDPAWAASLGALHAPVPVPTVPTAPPAQRRVPTIVEPPPLPEVASASPADEAAPPRVPAPTAPMGPSSSALVAAPPQALVRMPVIVEPKAPPRPTPREELQMVGGPTSVVVPPLDVLEVNRRERAPIDKEAFLSTAEKLTAKLRDFGIEGEVVEIRPGPVVTMYEFKPAAGVKISRIASLSDDLAMAMEAMRVRIVAPIPGKGVVGIEVPNKERELVFLKEIAEQDAFQKSQSRLAMCLGKDIEGMPYILDLAKAPHLLMAGTTGSGKSVSVNAMIMSILLKSTPEEVRFIMVDPKMLELSVYEGIPHLLLPVVTDPRKAAIALQWAVDEMTRRYKLLAEAGVRNIAGYNALVDQEQARKVAPPRKAEPAPTVIRPAAPAPAPAPVEAAAPAEPPSLLAPPPRKKKRMLVVDVSDELAAAPTVQADALTTAELGVAVPAEPREDPREGLGPSAEAVALAEAIRVDEAVVALESQEEAAALAAAAATTGEAPEERKKLPYIVVIIDELADLMMVASKEVETSIARLAQMARAAGLHLMVATQRPSTDVVTGVIKANFPTRISFMLRTKPDSMTILGTIGAEALLGMGDMLIMPPTSAHMQRVHGCFVSEPEIKKVVDHLKAQGTPVYDESILKPRDGDGEEGFEDDLSDELYDQAIAVVSEMRQVSISMLQRKMRIGYNRSARMIERMEREGLVGPADGAKPRDVLIRPVGQMEA